MGGRYLRILRLSKFGKCKVQYFLHQTTNIKQLVLGGFTKLKCIFSFEVSSLMDVTNKPEGTKPHYDDKNIQTFEVVIC